MAKKVLAVFGATGNQGGSVIDNVLADPALSEQYTLRAITRDTTSQAAQALKQRGVEVVSADLDTEATLTPALKGAHTVFSVTVTAYDKTPYELEVKHGKTMADAAVAAGAQYLIYSSLYSATKVSNGKYPVVGFDAKAEVEQYIRSLPIKSSFYAPAFFMENFVTNMAPQPAPGKEGSFAFGNFTNSKTKLPLIAARKDIGKFVASILADPEKYEGKVVDAFTHILTWDGLAETASQVTGKQVGYAQLPEEVFRSFLPLEVMKINFANMFHLAEEFGVYESEKEDNKQDARGELLTFDKFLKEVNFTL